MAQFIDLAKEFFKAIENNEYDKLANNLADNFVFEGPVPEPLNKEQYLAFVKNLMGAFSELKYQPVNFKEEGNQVTCDVELTGKHTSELRMPNMDPIPATNKVFVLPKEPVTSTLNDEGKVTKIHASVSESGGVMGIVKQLQS
jgi:hypothetical protein